MYFYGIATCPANIKKRHHVLVLRLTEYFCGRVYVIIDALFTFLLDFWITLVRFENSQTNLLDGTELQNWFDTTTQTQPYYLCFVPLSFPGFVIQKTVTYLIPISLRNKKCADYEWLEKFRQRRSPDLLYCRVNLCAPETGKVIHWTPCLGDY